jgi:hypothetical protein
MADSPKDARLCQVRLCVCVCVCVKERDNRVRVSVCARACVMQVATVIKGF